MFAAMILVIHGIVWFAGAAFAWARSYRRELRVPYISGVLAAIVTLLLVAVLIDNGPGGGLGTAGAWYLIMSVTTAGIVPALTLFCAAWTGRFCALLARKILATPQAPNAPF